MALTREYWAKVDGKIWLSALRTTKTGAATDESNDLLSARIEDFQDTGFVRDVTHQRIIGGGYITNTGNYQAATINIDFVMSDLEFNTSQFQSFTQDSLSCARLTEDITPHKIRIQWQTISTDGGTGDTEAYRKVYYNCYGVSVVVNDTTDGYVRGTLQFSVAPFNEVGLPNYREVLLESTDAFGNLGDQEYADGDIAEWDVQMGYSDLI